MRGLTAEEARWLSEIIARPEYDKGDLDDRTAAILKTLAGVGRIQISYSPPYLAPGGLYTDVNTSATALGRLALTLYNAGIR